MYSLDINFLKDRNLNSDGSAVPERAASKAYVQNGKEPAPLIAGGIVAALCLLAVGFTFWQAAKVKAETQDEIALVDAELQQLNAQSAKIQSLTQDIESLKTQSQAFVEVLQTKIKPWSAILEEISDLTPPGLQLNSFEQSDNQVLVTGFARNFNDVNDLMLNLQTSPLFVEKEIYIVSANLVDNPTTLEFSRPVEAYNLTKVVEYTISLTLGDLTDAEIIKTLEAQGAKGIAERLKNSF
ncbi:MAG: PilN domain-containing protein [Limnothrix sp.]